MNIDAVFVFSWRRLLLYREIRREKSGMSGRCVEDLSQSAITLQFTRFYIILYNDCRCHTTLQQYAFSILFGSCTYSHCTQKIDCFLSLRYTLAYFQSDIYIFFWFVCNVFFLSFAKLHQIMMSRSINGKTKSHSILNIKKMYDLIAITCCFCTQNQQKAFCRINQ